MFPVLKEKEIKQFGVYRNEVEGAIHCPRCGTQLTTVAQGMLWMGSLAARASSNDGLNYLRPEMPESIL